MELELIIRLLQYTLPAVDRITFGPGVNTAGRKHGGAIVVEMAWQMDGEYDYIVVIWDGVATEYRMDERNKAAQSIVNTYNTYFI